MEDSSSDSQPRCPCGFWGSAKTLGLCSVCYRKAHRNQSQASAHTSDASRASIGTCHNQTQSNRQGMRMDSKHFPSRSTTDNLPSSLSSPPGERLSAAATAAASSTMDATTPTTSGNTTSTQTHMPTIMSANGVGGDITQPGPVAMTKPSCESHQVPSDSDTSSSASRDPSYDPKHDPGQISSDSGTSLISVASSIAVTLSSSTSSVSSNDECKTVDSQACGPQSSARAATDSYNASSQSTSNTSRTSGTTAETIAVIHNSVASSSKNTAARSVEHGNKQFNSSVSHERSAQATSTTIQPSAGASEDAPSPAERDSIASPLNRGVKRSRDEMEASTEDAPSPSPQKNKKRCFICSCKLELAQRTIGKCRCDRVFCALHRLPELHDCDFNHKEDGRREAREKMIKPTRHLGPSYRREDHS